MMGAGTSVTFDTGSGDGGTNVEQMTGDDDDAEDEVVSELLLP